MKNISTRSLIFFFFIFTLPFITSAQEKSAKPKPTIDPKLVYGKYGCTSSRYSGGSVQYTPRGSFEVTEKGKYTYFGFEKPSTGTFTVDKKGNLAFKGGYFNGGNAEKIDRPNKFFVAFPSNPDNRWTCSLVDKK